MRRSKPDQGGPTVPRNDLLQLLADPFTGAALELALDSEPPTLVSKTGRRYPIRDGIPRFVLLEDEGQVQTADAFDFKWGRQETYGSEPMRRSTTEWLLKRYGFGTTVEMRDHLAGSGRLLDLGCGSGYTTSLWINGWEGAEYVGVDISQAIEIAKQRLGIVPRSMFVQADALHLPLRQSTFGAIISEGVLHHTPSTREALLSAARVLRKGGEILFYVYRKKGPIREWTDDYVRDRIAGMSNAEAWKEMEALTSLAQALTGLKAEVDVPQAIDVLGIPAGRVDVQRLIYWHFAKVFWNDNYSFDENVHVNFDWYRPRYAHRQTEEQLEEWCVDASLEIQHLDRDPAGYTVRAVRQHSGGR